MLIVNGLPEVEFKNMVKYLNEFFQEFLELSVQVDDFFFIGVAKPRAIVVTMQSVQEKKLILRNKRYLKDIGSNVYITDYTPLPTQEKRRRDNDVAELGVKAYGEEKVQYTKAGLTINGKPYRKQVQPPTPKTLIDVDPAKLEAIIRTPMQRGEEIRKEHSVFIGYSTDVRSHQEVRELYIKMKTIQPGARHIAVAYWVSHQDEFYALDYHDDDEPGIGRILMNLLRANNIRNKVIFVARRYGGQKIGPERFQCYLDAAISALEKSKYNEILRIDQHVVHREQKKIMPFKRFERVEMMQDISSTTKQG